MRRVLVLQLARFGDLVQTKRLLLSLAAEQDTEVHLGLDRSLAQLASVLYPFAVIHRLPAHLGDGDPLRVFAEARRVFAAFSALDFAEVYILNYSPLAFACSERFDPEQLRGYARIKGQNMRGPWQNIALNLVRDRRFSPINLADIWACWHPAPIAPEKVNPIPRPAGGQRLGLVMAGRETRRSLPPKQLAACLQAVFQARGGPEIVCIGTRQESVLVRRLLRELPPATAARVRDLTGSTSLSDLPEVLLGLDCLLSPDTGTMHLAAHLGVPVQAFFLSSAWAWETGPYGLGHSIWQAKAPCSPCLESAPCKQDLACLQPFAHPAFLAHLSGRAAQVWPEQLLGCVTMLDDLGTALRIVDGGDPCQDARQELRNGLAAWLGKERADAPAFMRQDLAEYLFREKDWMLPANWPEPGVGKKERPC